MNSTVDFLIALDDGFEGWAEDDIIAGFQPLIDSGMAWQLQGRIGRQCAELIDAGACHAKGDNK